MAPVIYQELFGTAYQAPDRPCLAVPGRSGGSDEERMWTYGALDDYAARIAGAVRRCGVGVGDRVAVQVTKSADAVALYLACLRAGAVYLPLNTAYTGEEVAVFVRDSEAALFVGHPGDNAPPGVRAETLAAGGEGTIPRLAAEATPLPVVEREGDAWAAMLYTSGTTGRAKGAMLSCRNLAANARALVEAWRFGPDDVLLHILPIFHVHGLFVALHCAFAVGATVRLHDRFDVSAVRSDLRRSTVMMGVPTHYRRLLDDPAFGATDCESMRLFTSGSAPLLAETHEQFTARTGHRIVERYGMTETMILTSSPYDGERVAGTVGFPLRGVELRVVDDGGRPVPAGVDGVVEVRGDGVGPGYWNLPDATAASRRRDPDGTEWFITGDIGSVDGEGRLSISGRVGDMIICGGLNVYPKEIEQVLDGVDGVAESAVIGVQNSDLGEEVVAVIVPSPNGEPPTADALSAACTGLARFKQPRRFEFVDELPRNAMGKVQKAALRRRFG